MSHVVDPMNCFRCGVLVCVAAIGGCAAAPSVETFAIDALGESIVRTICGNSPPTAETVPNPHVDGVLDVIERRGCNLGSSTLYVSTQASDPSGLAMNLKIYKPGSGVPEFMEIGKPVSNAIRRLGKPGLQSGGSFTYVFGDYEDEFTIQAPGGVIHSLAWSWSVD